MKNTVIQDLIEWLDRVEDRGIKSLSTEKIRERINERKVLEKNRLYEFHKAGSSGESLANTVEKFKFPENEKTT